MSITQVAAYTPTDRRPQAFALSSPAALEVNNQTTMRLVVFVSRTLRDVLLPGDHKIYSGLNNLAVAPTWALVQPDDIPDSGGPLNGVISLTTYGVSDALPARGSYTPGSFSVPMLTQQDRSSLIRPLGVLNVLDFNAAGDGVTDDRLAIQAALDVARVIGGAEVKLPANTYLIGSTATHPVTGGGQQAGLVIGANTRLVGDGPGATIIRCGSLANQTWIIANYQSVANTDTDITFADFTLDGNAAAQAGTVDAQYGIFLVGVNGATFNNVEAKHVYGINAGGNGPNGTPGEGMTFDLTGCSHVYYSQCRAYSDGVMNTSTGFSANACNDVAYVNCWAYGLKNSMGFTNWKCWSARYTNCWATSCGNDGFHSELCDGLYWVNCTSGGTTNPLATNPYAANTALGSVKGFQLFQTIRAVVSNCIAEKNSQAGIYIASATGPVKIVGGSFNNNTLYGIQCADAASVTQTTIKARPTTAGNGSGEVWYNGALVGLTTFAPGAAVPVPATTVPFTNPFPFDAMVYITAGTVTVVAVDATTVFTATPCAVLVRQGGAITLTYSVAPTWKWEACG